MVHACNHVGTDGTVLFHDDDNGVDDADKHFTHLSQAADCCQIERSKQNEHVVYNKDNGVDDGVDNGVDNGYDDSVEDGDDAGAGDSEDENDVDDVVDNDDDGDDDSVEDGAGDGDGGADKHLTHLSQASDCCLMEKSKQNEH
eukprot:12855746-Ditylum_brightwellii.AAC.1